MEARRMEAGRVEARRKSAARVALAAAGAAWLSLGAAGAARARTVQVRLRNIEFDPAEVRLEPGDRIEFRNEDPFEHTVFLVNAANPNAVILPDRKLPPGKGFTMDPIEAKGIFVLYCTLHGGMKARVTTTGSFELTEEMKRAAAAALPPEVKQGEELFWGKAQCFRCHSMGKRGEAIYGPNLEDIGLRAASRAKDRGLDAPSDYLVESVLHPDAFLVPGYPNDMIRAYQPPVSLGRDELVRVIAYLESQGGRVDLWSIDVPDSALEAPPPAGLPLAERDPEAGEQLFADLGCPSCHRIGDHAGGIGPELTHIGAYRDEAFLLREVVDPNAVVPAPYRPISMHLADGGQLRGVLRRETPKAYLVKVSDETVRTVPKTEARDVKIQTDTNMPSFSEVLTIRQLADLLAYLESLR